MVGIDVLDKHGQSSPAESKTTFPPAFLLQVFWYLGATLADLVDLPNMVRLAP